MYWEVILFTINFLNPFHFFWNIFGKFGVACLNCQQHDITSLYWSFHFEWNEPIKINLTLAAIFRRLIWIWSPTYSSPSTKSQCSNIFLELDCFVERSLILDTVTFVAQIQFRPHISTAYEYVRYLQLQLLLWSTKIHSESNEM